MCSWRGEQRGKELKINYKHWRVVKVSLRATRFEMDHRSGLTDSQVILKREVDMVADPRR